MINYFVFSKPPFLIPGQGDFILNLIYKNKLTITSINLMPTKGAMIPPTP